MSSGRIVQLGQDIHGHGLYSTPEMVAIEKNLLKAARKLGIDEVEAELAGLLKIVGRAKKQASPSISSTRRRHRFGCILAPSTVSMSFPGEVAVHTAQEAEFAMA